MDEYICCVIYMNKRRIYYAGVDYDNTTLKTNNRKDACRFDLSDSDVVVTAMMNDDVKELRIIRVNTRENDE